MGNLDPCHTCDNHRGALLPSTRKTGVVVFLPLAGHLCMQASLAQCCHTKPGKVLVKSTGIPN